MKIDKKFIGIIVIVLLAIAIVGVYTKLGGEEESYNENDILVKTYEDNDYYIFEDDYDEEYYIEYVDYSEHFGEDDDKYDNFPIHEVLTYEEYEEYCDMWGINKKYKTKDKKYIVFSYLARGSTDVKARLGGVLYNDKKATLYVWDDMDGVVASILGYVIVIPTDKDVKNVEIQPMYTETEFENIKKYGSPNGKMDYTVKKPVLYFYPEETIDIKVKLLKDYNITTSYPKYDNEWIIRANSNGDLLDLKTNKKLYSLYYEANVDEEYKVEDEGFIVSKDNIIVFLEEKLDILGLNYKEKEEFIIYWLPILENNEYNYIRFATREEIDSKIPISIEPSPDTFIRIVMTYKGLDTPINVKEQVLEKTIRQGYTVVEWGGTLIK